jgi:putative endonuclease
VRHASGALLDRRDDLPPDAMLGRLGEEAAYWHLRENGWVMVERNYRAEGLRGEIDLIGWEKETLVFVEVKTRRSADVLTPEASVDMEKRRNVIAAADRYRSRAGASSKPFRFDIISVIIPDGVFFGGEKPASPSRQIRLQHFRDAFRH